MTARPLVIAHRGASGYLPEHTREAKMLAYGQGADYLEQDVVATRDGQLVVLHDVYLDVVTNVAERFGGRQRDDGRFYVVDFTLEELRSLRVLERRRPGTQDRVFPQRFADDDIEFRIVTLDEEISLVRALNATTRHRVGLYPEIKAPAFHREHGIDLAARVLETLARFGYMRAEDPVIVQCFDAKELARCRFELGTALKLAQLTEETPAPANAASTSEASAANLELAAQLESIARYAQVWAPAYDTLLERPNETAQAPHRRAAGGAGLPRASAAVADAKRAGLEIHPYTFRNDAVPPEFNGLEQLLEHFYREIGVDAVFCDHPDIAVRVRRRLVPSDRQRQPRHIE